MSKSNPNFKFKVGDVVYERADRQFSALYVVAETNSLFNNIRVSPSGGEEAFWWNSADLFIRQEDVSAALRAAKWQQDATLLDDILEQQKVFEGVKNG